MILYPSCDTEYGRNLTSRIKILTSSNRWWKVKIVSKLNNEVNSDPILNSWQLCLYDNNTFVSKTKEKIIQGKWWIDDDFNLLILEKDTPNEMRFRLGVFDNCGLMLDINTEEENLSKSMIFFLERNDLYQN
ncbi:MAG: hypothetical protein EAZ07_06175 [Cytophagales bacterium]|nr:MAG: hypothetical protein EAZ07_06175 [Cytophagales bacterium]